MYQTIHELLQKPIPRTEEARAALRQWLQQMSEGVILHPIYRREHTADEEDRFSGEGTEETKQEHPFLRQDLIIKGALLHRENLPSRSERIDGGLGGMRVGGGASRADDEIYLLEDGGVLECEAETSWYSSYNPSDITDTGVSSTRRKMVYHLVEALDEEDIERIASKLSKNTRAQAQ